MKFLTIFFIVFFSQNLLFLNICLGDDIHQRQVIIDTDMGLDDARALAWLLEMHNINIKGIITSEGAMDPVNGLQNLKAVLEYFGREEIPICIGSSIDGPAPSFRPMVMNAFSGFQTSDNNFKVWEIDTFYKVISDSMEDESITYLCLGPLSNLHFILENDSEFLNKINKIIFAGNSINSEILSWNTERDIQASKSIFNSFRNICEMNMSKGSDLFFNSDLIEMIIKSNNKVSEFVQKIHNIKVDSEAGNIHMFLYDDLLPLFMQYPEFFTLKATDTGEVLVDMDIFLLQSAYKDFIENGFILTSRPSVVFNEYPIHDELFRDDVADYLDTLISIHGLEEWKAAILTNEMHRHLGAYSLVGVKMGILARELLKADLDELNVVAYTGSKPPESCLIDGLQIATGASLGRGTIQNSIETNSTPKAVFIKDSARIRIELKTEAILMIQSEIQHNTNKFGYGSHRYFDAIRKMSIELWVNLNRKYMFDVYDDVSGEKIL